jgi:hypothetical protein
LKYFDFPLFFSGIKKKFGLSKIVFTYDEKAFLNYLSSYILTNFSVSFDVEACVRKDLLQRKSDLPFYLLLLKKVKPKLSIIVVSYGKETFIEACKHLQIPVIEFQHGVLGLGTRIFFSKT